MRTRENTVDQDLIHGFDPTTNSDIYAKVAIQHRRMSDVNNGKFGPRPESPCIKRYSVYEPTEVKNVLGHRDSLLINAVDVSSHTWRASLPVMEDQYDRCLRHMQVKIDEQIGGFSTLNFLYELREIGDLFKKLKTPEDFRYIDWQFAIAPTLSDLRNALTAYNGQVASLNDKLKRYRTLPCNRSFRKTTFYKGDVTYGVGNAHYQDETYRIQTKMRGSIEMDVPILSQVCPALFVLLDDLQIDVSASNAWNAIPWSWFFDWFAPVGEFLETLPSGMKPLTRFVGTISHSVTGFATLETKFSPPAFAYFGGQEAGRLVWKHYERTPFSGPRSSMVRWRLDSLSSPSQVALLRDIMFPADIKRGKSILR